MATHREENKMLLNHFLNRTFFRDFSTDDEREKLYDNLELMITPKCNLSCKYCYYSLNSGYGRQLNPPKIAKHDNVLKNIDAILNYLLENNYFPSSIEIFSGEPLIQPVTFEIIEKLINYYDKSPLNKSKKILIPTNMSFIRNKNKYDKFVELKNKGKRHGIIIGASASIDGWYMDYLNRQVGFAKDQSKFYNEDFYNGVFQFAKDVGCGFHPMIYHNNIEQWIDNFLWFQNKFEKFGIPWNNIYLLEIRNDGWTKKTIQEYMKFYKFVLEWSLNKVGDKENYINNFVFNGRENNINNMNLFNNIGKIGRGIGCSMQTTLPIRVGDLNVASCHRQSYDMFNGFKFVKENGKIVDIEPLNLEYYLSTISLDTKNFPYCESCMIKHICNGGCLGAQYETTGDPFTPIQSVCLLEFGKVKTQIEFFKENNMFDSFINKLPSEQKLSFELINNKVLEKE